MKRAWLTGAMRPSAQLVLGALFFVISTIVISQSPLQPVYDEIHYRPYAVDLSQQGFGLDYLRELKAPTGPLYGFLHLFVQPLTRLEIVSMRMATNVFFLLSACGIALLVLLLKAKSAVSVPALAYGIPVAGVVLGVALTEAPSMLAASLGTLALVKGLEVQGGGNVFAPASGKQLSATTAYFLFFLGALLYAAAVWGRQNYLMVVFALPVLFASRDGFRFVPWIVTTSIICLFSLFLFWAWGGIVPEAVRFVSGQARDPEAGGTLFGLNLSFGILSLAYASVVFLFLSPAIFISSRGCLMVSTSLAALAVWTLPQLRFIPSKFLLERLVGTDVTNTTGIVLGFATASMGFLLAISLATHCLRAAGLTGGRGGADAMGVPFANTRPDEVPDSLVQLRNKLYIFAALAFVLILASNMKISHQFTSRYVVVAAPFILLLAASHFKPTRGAALRLGCGFAVSIMLLANCYRWL